MTTSVVEGIVLRRTDYAEADRILTVLTRERGKLGVMARAARKSGSRMGAATDLFAHSRMQLARGRGALEVMTQAQRLGAPPVFSTALRAAAAGVCAEVVDRVVEPGHHDPPLFDLVSVSLRACGDLSRSPRAAVSWCCRRLMNHLGYAPQLHACAGCGGALAEASAWFDAAAGGLVCADCGNADALLCSVRVIKTLRVIADGPDQLFWRLRLDPTILDCLEAIIERELAHHLDRQLRSFGVMRALVAT